MLLTETYFKSFTTKSVVDASTATEAILSLSADSRAAVDELVETAIAADGVPPDAPRDQGFTYSRSFADPDGHPVARLYTSFRRFAGAAVAAGRSVHV